MTQSEPRQPLCGGGGAGAAHWGLCCTELTLHGRALGTLRTPAVLWCRRAESSAQARPEAGPDTCTAVKTPALAPSRQPCRAFTAPWAAR